jgi:hypothetical protein
LPADENSIPERMNVGKGIYSLLGQKIKKSRQLQQRVKS